MGRDLDTKQSGPPPDDSKWADAISQAQRHVESGGSVEDDGVGRPALRGPVLGLLGVLVAVSIAVVTVQVSEPAPATLTATDQASDLRLEAALLIEQIEAYKEEQGMLPDAFMLAPYLAEGYEYQVIDRARGVYIVRREAAGVTVTYDGSLPVNLWVLLGGGTSGGAS